MTRIGRSKGSVAGAVAGLLVLLTGLTAWAQAPKAERPTYAVGDKWIRSDGAYDLIRVENGRYVFAADGGREVHLTRDLGVNLAGVEIILNMRRKMEQMQGEFGDFLQQLREELHKSRGEGLEEKIEQALVRLPPAHIVRSAPEHL